MNGIRRGLILLILSLAVIVGTPTPPSATYSTPAVPTTTVSTPTVAAPGNLVGKLTCGRPAPMAAPWSASGTARGSGYLVSVYFSDGFVQTVQLGPPATSWSATIDPYYVTAYSINYTVTTQTDYGWTKESAHTGTFQC